MRTDQHQQQNSGEPRGETVPVWGKAGCTRIHGSSLIANVPQGSWLLAQPRLRQHLTIELIIADPGRSERMEGQQGEAGACTVVTTMGH
ncbi:hypothetical protein ACCAA_870005 [Candidatus Accumulibacter aalborgensis]|uniref:Uncharacterized protein n=1 Tax=Candidatus Accumulibacter aalborgensis TaxID=1860102 RepID=A0A1A8Y159_9PROT|nr:hypothetical protein ACCAA_870005 [Candidatus Accumulibacter aalborgensis]